MIKAIDWKPAGGITLEPNALLAAREQQQNLALTAGPGAGKTEMLAQRADFLLRTGACYFPNRILAISFKVDAAANLKRRVRLRCGADLAARFDSLTFHAFAKRLIDTFRPVLQGRDALDPDYTIGEPRVTRRQIGFPDLVPLANEIVSSSEMARNAIRLTYTDVLLDEFQDCTNEQYTLILNAFHNSGIRLAAVGDTKQKIMGWAGALEGIFLRYATDFHAQPLNLYQNFRSKPRLRRMQNAMVSVMDRPAALDETQIIGEEGEIELLFSADPIVEAHSIAQKIEGWLENGTKRSEIAILIARQLELYAPALKVELVKRGISFRDETQLQDLAQQPIAALIFDGLTLAAQETAPDAYSRILDLYETSSRGDHAEYQFRLDLSAFCDGARIATTGDKSLLTDAKFIERLAKDFLALFQPETLVALSPEYEQGARLNDLVAETLGQIRNALADGLDLAAALRRFSTEDSIKIMTIHKSKGLEFEKVVILAVETETFWSKPDEERSTFFVGISRAKETLVLTFAGQRPWPSGAKRWRVGRQPHPEFIGYARPYLPA